MFCQNFVYLKQVHFELVIKLGLKMYLNNFRLEDNKYMENKEKHLGLRLDEYTHRKLKSLAEFEGRSINGEVIYLIKQAIIKFEKENGKLE